MSFFDSEYEYVEFEAEAESSDVVEVAEGFVVSVEVRRVDILTALVTF